MIALCAVLRDKWWSVDGSGLPVDDMGKKYENFNQWWSEAVVDVAQCAASEIVSLLDSCSTCYFAVIFSLLFV